MTETDKKLNSLYSGYRILLLSALFVFILAAIFTYILRILLMVVCTFILLASALGIIRTIDQMKQNGWTARPTLQKLLCLPVLLVAVWFTISPFHIALKSIIDSLAAAIMLWLIKPQKRKEEK